MAPPEFSISVDSVISVFRSSGYSALRMAASSASSLRSGNINLSVVQSVNVEVGGWSSTGACSRNHYGHVVSCRNGENDGLEGTGASRAQVDEIAHRAGVPIHQLNQRVASHRWRAGVYGQSVERHVCAVRDQIDSGPRTSLGDKGAQYLVRWWGLGYCQSREHQD